MSNDELIVVPAQEVVTIPAEMQTGDLDAFSKAAARLHNFERLRHMVLQTCRASDFHSFGQKPWPLRSAIEKIQRGLGLNTKIHVMPDGKRYTKSYAQDADGSYYLITITCTISGPWGELEAMGFTSSRDIFFASAGRDKDGKQLWKEAFEVKEENLIQAAYTNAITNGVMRYTGISGFTQEDMEGYYGKGAVSQHTYASGAPKKTTADVVDLTTAKLELRAICLTMCEGIESDAALLLADMSKFTGKDGKLVAGVERVDRLSEGRLKATLGTAKKRWAEFLKSAGEQSGFYEGLLKSRMKPTEAPESEGV